MDLNGVYCITSLGRSVLEQYRVKRAIIMAAGVGSRMLPITKHTPKPLVCVNGKPMIETALEALIKAEIYDITIVVGHLADRFLGLKSRFPSIKLHYNDQYLTSNNISSAFAVRHLLDSTYIIEGDIFIQNPDIIRKYEYRSNYCGIPVTKTNDWYFKETYDVISELGFICEGPCYQYMGISYWTKTEGKILASNLYETFINQNMRDIFMEAIPLRIYKDKHKLFLRKINKNEAIEFDTIKEIEDFEAKQVANNYLSKLSEYQF